MDIQFDTELIRRICISKAVAEKKFGESVARHLQSRLSDIRAANNIFEVLVGLKDKTHGQLGQRRMIDLTSGYEMIFEANNKKPRLTGGGLIDWIECDRVKILSVEKGVVS